MFERFTERARQVVVLAQDEARRLRHNYIGTEHLLLGLIREEEGIAARALESLNVSLDEVRAAVGRIVGHGNEVASGQIPFTPRAKLVLERSLRQALSLGHNHIGTEHLLLALVRESEGVATRILSDLGASPGSVWAATFRTMGVAEPPEWTSLAPSDEVSVSLFAAGDRDDWSAWLYESWPAMAAGAAIFASGLFVGWLIWG